MKRRGKKRSWIDASRSLASTGCAHKRRTGEEFTANFSEIPSIRTISRWPVSAGSRKPTTANSALMLADHGLALDLRVEQIGALDATDRNAAATAGRHPTTTLSGVWRSARAVSVVCLRVRTRHLEKESRSVAQPWKPCVTEPQQLTGAARQRQFELTVLDGQRFRTSCLARQPSHRRDPRVEFQRDGQGPL